MGKRRDLACVHRLTGVSGMTNHKTIQALGQLAVLADGQPSALGGHRQHAVLARLVVAYPDPVSAEQLSDAVWGDHPPRQANGTIQAYISRLRKALAPDLQISSGGSSYRLQANVADLDWATFLQAVRRGASAAAAHRHGEVLAILEPALRMWHSEPLQPFTEEPWAAAFADKLRASRLDATELLATAYLECQNPQAAAELLEPVVTATPYAESLARLLMIALYRSGRQAGAIQVYSRSRRALDDELGLEPSAALQSTFTMVLRQDPDLEWQPDPAASPRIVPPRPQRLVGRVRDIADVEQCLAAHGAAVLYGLPGVGKTVLAAEIAHRHPGIVCWIPAEGSGGLAALTELASRLGVSPLLGTPELLQALWRQLDERPDWLLVFDNAGRADTIAAWVPPVRNGQILVTSRNPAWGRLGPAIKINPLEDEAAIEFIRHRAPRGAGDPKPLALAMGGISLALEQACRYIDETGMSIDRYLRIYRRRRRELLAKGAPDTHPHPVTTTWEMLVDDITERSPLAESILEVCSFLWGDDIPLSLFEKAFDDQVGDLELEDAVGELVQYSIVDRDTTTLRLHPFVQELIRAQLTPERQQECVSRGASLLKAGIPADTTAAEADMSAWSVVFPHLLALLRAMAPTGKATEDLVEVTTGCFRHLRSRLAFQSAHELMELALGLAKQPGVGTSLTRAELLICNAELLDAEGYLAEAEAELTAAREMLGRLHHVPDLTVARLRSLSGHIHNCADRPAEAIAEYEAAVRVLRRHGNRSDAILAYIGLGYSRWSAQDFPGAAAEFRAALALMDHQDWGKHPLHIEAISGLGMMLHEQGEVSEAIELQTIALADSNELYGDSDHPATAYIHDKLGYALGLNARYEESLQHHRTAADILRRLYGPHDARLAIALSNQGLAEQACGRLGDASASHRDAVRILESAPGYGAAHRDTKLVRQRLMSLVRQAS